MSLRLSTTIQFGVMNQVRRLLADLGVQYDDIARNNKVCFPDASVSVLSAFIDSCSFLNNRYHISAILRQNYIDGKCLMQITEDEWVDSLGLDLRSFLIISVMTNTWNATSYCNKIVDHSHHAPEGGEICYGEVIVLGYASYFSIDGQHLPIGKPNEKFVLRMKPGNNDNKSYDCFQVGRLEEPLNDFSIKGPLRQTKALSTTSPLSRFALRILCQRQPPYESFVYASGYDQQGILGLGDCSLRVGNDDALTSFGIKLFNRHVNEWYEISINGNPYSLRTFCRNPGNALLDQQKYSNELHDGSIIDCSGSLLLFRKYITKNDNQFPRKIMQLLTKLNASCPVSLNPLSFDFICAKDRGRRALKYLRSSSTSWVPFCSYSDRYSDIDNENTTPFVYVDCGHVHQYHKMLEKQPCSLCRRAGPFVQIKYTYTPQIDSGKPTCVFNPCGHLSSRQCALEYSSLKMPVIYDHDLAYRPQCPFCLTHLKETNPFTRLIFQLELGKSWDDEDVEVDPKTVVDMDKNVTYTPRFMIRKTFSDKRDMSFFDNISSQIDHENI